MKEHLVRIYLTVETMAAGANVGDAAEKTIETLQDLMDINDYKVIRIWDGSKIEEVNNGKVGNDS